MNTPSNSSPSIWQRLTAPHPALVDLGERRRATLLAQLSLALIPFIIAATFLGMFMQTASSTRAATTSQIALLSAFVLTYVLARTRYHNVGGMILALSFLGLAVRLAVTEDTPLNEILFSLLPIMFVIAIALFNNRSMWLLLAATLIALAMIFYLEQESDQGLIYQTFGITTSIAILTIIVVNFRDKLEQDRLAELRFANQELTAIKSELEIRVQQRTADLNSRSTELEWRSHQMETVSKISSIIASIQDLDKLLTTITYIVSEQFGFYHTGIFFISAQSDYAVLRAANSEGGQRMLQRGHRLRLGTGIVGYVAAQGDPRIVLNVGSDSIYFNNPDLPDTRSEAALPLKIGNQIIGVLDVQSVEQDAFHSEDIEILGILANQVAVAIENARLFGQTRQALDESQATYEGYIKQEWSRFARRINVTGFHYDGIKTTPLSTAPSPADVQAASIPVRIRGLIIGHILVRANDSQRKWTQDELNLVRAAADRAGLAIENVRLLGEAQRRAAKERAIGEITSRIAASIDINSILQTAVEELGHTLPGSEIILQFEKRTDSSDS